MKRSVFKYSLVGKLTAIELPEDAQILSAIEQDGRIVVYCLVNTETKQKRPHSFLVVPTGEAFDLGVNYRFVATIPFASATLVLHVFHEYA